jgi:hypothetical protein
MPYSCIKDSPWRYKAGNSRGINKQRVELITGGIIPGGINKKQWLKLKCSLHNQESILALRTCNTSSLPLDHLDYTCFNSFFILLNSFSSRVELINNDAWH